jgi:hypothetical protein
MTTQTFDPFDNAPQFGNLPFERLATQLLQHLPEAKVERTSDAIQLTTGDFRDEAGLVILLSPGAIEFRLPVLIWLGPHEPANTSQLWQRIELSELTETQLPELIAAARLQQQQNFSDCKYCGKHNPRGWMHSPDICESCAFDELGIIH